MSANICPQVFSAKILFAKKKSANFLFLADKNIKINTSCQTECAKINFSLPKSAHERSNTKSRLRKGGREPTLKRWCSGIIFNFQSERTRVRPLLWENIFNTIISSPPSASFKNNNVRWFSGIIFNFQS